MPRSRLLLIALAYLAFVSLGLPDGLLGVAWPSIRASFGLPLDALGLLFLTTTAGYLLASFSSGHILRIMNVGVLLALSAAATGISLLVFGVSPSWGLIVGIGILLGLGAGAIDAGLNTYAAAHFSARTMNWLHASFGLGATAGPLIVTAVLSAGLVWRWAYLLVGGAQILLALVFAWTRGRWRSRADANRLESSGPTPASPTPASPAPTVTARETLRLPLTWLGVALFFVYAGLEVTAGQWSYSVLTLSRGVAEVSAGLWVSLYWGSLTVGRVVFGIVVGRAPIVPLLRACLFLITLGAVLFALNLSPSATATGLILMGLALAPIFPSLISATPLRLGREHAQNAIGFQVGAAGLGIAVLPALVGVAARSLGLEVVGVALVGGALLLVALFEGMTAASRGR